MSIRVIDLEKTHPGCDAKALARLSLEVEPGKVASVVGKSGAGKTTLLRCLVGLEAFDAGSIAIDGITVASGARDATALLAGKVGLVFQSFELFPHLSVIENVTLAPRVVRRKPAREAEARAKELLASLGLEDKAPAYPEELSGGQKQRVAIARALAMEPRALLYDEPTSALDPSLKGEVARTVRRVAETGVTQILVTHDLDVARAASDVVFVLDEGRVVESGSPADVLDAPKHDATRALLRDA